MFAIYLSCNEKVVVLGHMQSCMTSPNEAKPFCVKGLALEPQYSFKTACRLLLALRVM